MNLPEAIGLIETVAPKEAGQLIKPKNWNDLIEGVLIMASELAKTNDQADSLKIVVDELSGKLTKAQDEIDELNKLKEAVTPLLNQYIVKTRTDRLSYALGEMSTIIAEVTDLKGNPVAGRPWVDFVTSWGRLRPVGGFDSRGGEGGNSISVRTDSNGIARVMLRANNSERFSYTEELQVANLLETTVATSGTSFAQTILQESAPAGIYIADAYKLISTEYEKQGQNIFKAYADNYQYTVIEKPTIPSIPMFTLPGWQDYRATVMAFAKPDGDPTTPDNTRGGSTIQITFRDWLFNWINDYVFNVAELEPTIAAEFEPMWLIDNPVYLAENIQIYMETETKDLGDIGKRRFLTAQEAVLNNLTIASEDVVKSDIKTQLAGAVANQMLLGFGGDGGGLSLVMSTLNNGKQASQVKSEVKEFGAELASQASVKDSVVVLEGRMQATETMGGRIETKLTSMIDNVASINAFDDSSIQSGVEKLNAEFLLIKSILNP